MQYKIFKLKFKTPVHFGSEKVGTSLENTQIICHSDTLFSAMCQEILKIYGEIKLLDFVDMVEDEELLFSSLLPYRKNDLFLPKPCLLLDKEGVKGNTSSSIKKKKMKKLEYISINDFENYIESLKTGNDFEYDEEEYNICETATAAKVSPNREDDKNNIYYVASTQFKKNCGLYVLVAFKDDEQAELFENTLKSLGYSGIGGKRSSGYGKFEIEDEMYPDPEVGLEEERLIYSLLEADGDYQEALSVVSPSKEELEDNNFDNAFYKLISRNGYVYSTTYTEENTLVKRKSLSMFKEGSCFPFDIKGEIKDVSDNGNHPVYKCGKMLKIGVKL